MKKLLIIFSVSVFALSSCESDNEPNPTVNGESKVVTVTYPEMSLIGPDYIVSDVTTGTYADAGATAYDAYTGQTTTLTPYSNNVDLTTEGFYSVKFRFKNVNGYESFIIRVVLVTSVNSATDISGFYRRVGNGSPVNVTKVDRGLYWNDNIAGSTRIRAYMGFTNDTTLAVTDQISDPVGEISCSNTSFQMDASDTSFAWVVHAAGFGTALRGFTHQ